VEILAPSGDRRYQWAAPGDAVLLDEALPFPYRFQGAARLRWERDGDRVLVNGEAAAVDLSNVPYHRIRAVAAAGRRAGARCALWQGAFAPSEADIQALSSSLASAGLKCLGMRIGVSLADHALEKLARLASRLRLLDLVLHAPRPKSLAPFRGLQVLVVRPHRPSIYRDPKSLPSWKHLHVLSGLEHLRAMKLEPDEHTLSTLMRLRHLRRLEVAALPPAALVRLAKHRTLVSLSARVTGKPPKGQPGPGHGIQSRLRELRFAAPDSWSAVPGSPLDWIRGLTGLRILGYQHEPMGATPDYRGFDKLEVLETDSLVSEKGRSRVPPSVRVVELRAFQWNQELAPPGDLLRGLPRLKRLALKVADLRGDRSRVLRGAPTLESLRCKRCRVDAQTLASLGKLSRLTDLDVELGTAALAGPERKGITHTSLAHLRRLQNLRRLKLAHARIGDRATVHLSQLTELRWLDLAHTRISDAGLQRLEKLRHLQWLSLRATRISSEGVAALRRLSKLRHLDLTATAVGDRALTVIRSLTRLRWLSLEATHLEGARLEALGQLHGLRVLKLGHSTLPAGALAAARGSCKNELEAPKPPGRKNGKERGGRTTSGKQPTSDITGGDESAAECRSCSCTNPKLPSSLHTLDVSGIPLQKSDVAAIGALPRIRNLWMVNCRLTGEALRPLERSRTLERLILSWNPLQVDDLEHLLPLVNLRRIVLRPSELPAQAIADFQAAHPHLEPPP
jgi:hypothetical protein